VVLAHELAQPRDELRPQVGTFRRELDDGAQVLELVAGVVAASAELDAVDGPALVGGHVGEGAQRVGQLDLAAAPRRGLLQDVEHRGVADVAANDDPVAGRLVGRGLLDQVGDPDDVVLVRRLDGRAAVRRHLVGLDLHQRDHAAAVPVPHLDHALQQLVAGVDHVVAEQHRERLVADVLARAVHGVPEPARLTLAHVVHDGEVAGLLDGPQAFGVALGAQRLLQFVRPVEVVLDGPLAAAGDHEDVVEAGVDRLLDDVLDRRLVDDGQHFLGCRLGGGQESGTEPGRRDDRLEHRCIVGHVQTLATHEDGSVQDIVSKSDLRAELLRRRAAMPPDARAAAGRSIRDALLSVPEVEMAGTVAAYVSVGTEPDTHGLLFALWKRGAYVILPRLLPDGDLDWASYEGPDSLVPGPRGCLEPSEPPRGPGA